MKKNKKTQPAAALLVLISFIAILETHAFMFAQSQAF